MVLPRYEGYLLVYTLWYTRVVYTSPTMLSRVHYARSPHSAHARRYPVVRACSGEECLGSSLEIIRDMRRRGLSFLSKV